jgi:hypothetical protein
MSRPAPESAGDERAKDRTAACASQRAGNRVAERSKVHILEGSPDGVAADRAADRLNDEIDQNLGHVASAVNAAV